MLHSKTPVLVLLFCLLLCGTSQAAAKGGIASQVEKELLDQVRDLGVYPNEAVLAVRTLRPSDPALFGRAKVLSSLILPPGETGKGTVTAQVRFRLRGGSSSEEMVWVMAQLDVKVPTLVTSRPVQRGTVLGEGDVMVEMMPAGRHLANLEEAIGKIARRNLRAGETLRADMLTSPVIVRRGDLVDASVKGRTFSVQTKAEVLVQGGAGDVIRARILKTGKIVSGIVQKQGDLILAL